VRAIIRWCLTNRPVVILVAVLMMGAGVFATFNLNQELLPDISFPSVFIVTADPGAPYQLLGPPAGGQWSTTVASSGQAGWAVGIHDMTVRLSGTATLVTHGLLICTWMPPGQRSASSNAC